MACWKCGGAGRIAEYVKVMGGVCFRCWGTGQDPKKPALLQDREVRKEKTVRGYRIILRVQKDVTGRFLGYYVAVQGYDHVTGMRCKKLKDALARFNDLVKQASRGARFGHSA